MYGIVNKAIEDLVLANFGEDCWERVKSRSGVDVDYFISNEPYDDDLTYALARAIAEETNTTLSNVLISFGEWWVVNTTKVKYGGLMEAGGRDLREFLINLPQFHNRVMLIYPKLTPPEFKVSQITENSLQLHYFSKREGLQDFVRGLIQGLGIIYKKAVVITLLQTRDHGSTHEIFNISW
ncbi:heme NO-binding domain-containing protein [Flavobacterium sp. K77]|uniref:heme NO-binding domain-containing protein n=1 Tax=Flavobacterium sp. K77 TaxID=2910676 RepID=UPI001F229273|nr:heme NO-binding domain-containing protein [Flavobacterium sp. K77]MCF6141794.1 heme NO-binding domain-containing protein [Flavobacterium sp. K77]